MAELIIIIIIIIIFFLCGRCRTLFNYCEENKKIQVYSFVWCRRVAISYYCQPAMHTT